MFYFILLAQNSSRTLKLLMFLEASNKTGLLSDDNSWKLLFNDAFRSDFFPLSNEFTTILPFGQPSSSIDIWEYHREDFIKDIINIERTILQYLRVDSDTLNYFFK